MPPAAMVLNSASGSLVHWKMVMGIAEKLSMRLREGGGDKAGAAEHEDWGGFTDSG